jgi:hypothetical protein
MGGLPVSRIAEEHAVLVDAVQVLSLALRAHVALASSRVESSSAESVPWRALAAGVRAVHILYK